MLKLAYLFPLLVASSEIPAFELATFPRIVFDMIVLPRLELTSLIPYPVLFCPSRELPVIVFTTAVSSRMVAYPATFFPMIELLETIAPLVL